MFRGYRAAILAAAMMGCSGASHAADLWITPTPEELKMTGFDKAPGASAIILNYDESTEDELHMFSLYMRIKILNEEGRKYADQKLYASHENRGWASTIDDVQGRTIHPDGSIVPYTGKPYEKVIAKDKNSKETSMVITLPDVTVGSIIEFHYKRRWDDNYYPSSDWYIQKNLYVVKAHYVWKPSNRSLFFTNGKTNSQISYTPVLPKGAEVKVTNLPAVGTSLGRTIFETTVSDVPASVEEEYMPPLKSYSYRVLFYYTAYTKVDEFWEKEGKDWSKSVDRFATNSAAVKAFATQATTGATTPDEKLKKLYDAVMTMENTDFTRVRTATEEKSAGLKSVKTADDVIARKRGSGDDLTALFIALVRAEGMKAYAMYVVRRDDRLFFPAWLSFRQFDDLIAIVNVNGQEKFFDPGQKYVPFGHLDWKHTYANGIRQTEQGVKIATAPGDDFRSTQVQRIADLKIEPNGNATGVVNLTYIGAPAVRWRQRAARTDETELKRDLKDAVEEMLPNGMEVEVTKIDGLDQYESPLKISLKASGPIGIATAKRMILPGDIFEARTKSAFPHENRDLPVYFNYEVAERDVAHYVFPAGVKLESAPNALQDKYKEDISYSLKAESAPAGIIIRRDLYRNSIIFDSKEYPQFRTFYNKMQLKDQENVVIGVATPAGTN